METFRTKFPGLDCDLHYFLGQVTVHTLRALYSLKDFDSQVSMRLHMYHHYLIVREGFFKIFQEEMSQPIHIHICGRDTGIISRQIMKLFGIC